MSKNPKIVRTTMTKTTTAQADNSLERKGRTARAPTEGGRSVNATLLHTVPLFPVTKEIQGMIYYDYAKTLSGGVGSVPTHYYSANGIFDPDSTGIGHQPMGFDQMMALYEQATVIRANISVTFASAGEHARVGVFLNPDTTSPGLPRLVENGLIKMNKICGPSSSNGRYSYATVELSVDIPTYFGRTREGVLADPQMYTTIAANPGEQVYFGVCAWAGFDSSTDVTVGYDIVITYDAVFWEPKKLTSS